MWGRWFMESTSEKSGFFLVVLAALVYLGVVNLKPPEPARSFLLLLAGALAIWGGVLLFDWMLALFIRRVQDARLAYGQPALSMLSAVSRLNSEQITLVEKLGVVHMGKADYVGNLSFVYLSPWGTEIPEDWVVNYLAEIEPIYPKLRTINANGEGTTERQYNQEFTNWMLLWKLATRENARAGAMWVVSMETVRERLGLE